jgi:threonine/homoserine/homoserine lactone efflux protein
MAVIVARKLAHNAAGHRGETALRVWEFLLAALVSEITPGPNMGYLAILAMSRGRRIGYAAVAGVALGLALNGLAAALGVAALIMASPALYEALRWGGVLFLLFIAWEAWRTPVSATATAADLPATFRRGLVTNLLNPKAALFYVAVLPHFTDAARPLLPQTLGLTVLHVGVATLVHAAIVTFAAQATGLFADPARERLLRRVLAMALAAIALWFLAETRAS